ncbi:MAG: hypothetical protein ACTSRA_01485 [Promethearchaeota archaeon]
MFRDGGWLFLIVRPSFFSTKQRHIGVIVKMRMSRSKRFDLY